MAKESRGRFVTVNVDDVVVKDRHRKDVGDLEDLRQSILKVGLIHPIVITGSKRLVAGYRRLRAYKQMAKNEIEAVVVDNLSDATALLIAERDENICRKDFTPSEAVDVGRSLEELERPKAAERKAAGQKSGGKARHGQLDDKLPPSRDEPPTRDKVGSAIGMSGTTYQRAKAVVEAAEKEPQKYGPLRDEMDRTGKVTGVYNKMIATQPKSKATKPTKKKKAPAPKFRDDAYIALCSELAEWLQRRADKCGGLEAHDECDQLLGQLKRSIEKWRKQKPV